MPESSTRDADSEAGGPRRDAAGRRVVLMGAAAAGAASLVAGRAPAQAPSGPAPAAVGADAGRGGGLLRPQRNAHRELLDTSGLWRFQLDPRARAG